MCTSEVSVLWVFVRALMKGHDTDKLILTDVKTDYD